MVSIGVTLDPTTGAIAVSQACFVGVGALVFLIAVVLGLLTVHLVTP